MPSTNWTDQGAPGDDERFIRLAAELAEVQAARGGGDRALHAKQHAGARARLRVRRDLPLHLRAGVFIPGREYRAYVRFSNGSGERADDHKPDLRGLSMKLLGVDGPKVLGQGRTQDFLLVDTPTVPFRTPEQFVCFVKGVAQGGLVSGLVGELGVFGTLGLFGRLARSVKGSRIDVADLTYYGPAALAFGDYAVRLSAVPLHAASQEQRAGSTPDYLGERLGARIRSTGLEFDLRVQCFEEHGTPIDDVSVPWQSPAESVATLVIDAQEPSAELSRFVEQLSFDPFHALLDHRPLGAIMRARKHAYVVSTRHRNARQEPDGGEWEGFAARAAGKEAAL